MLSRPGPLVLGTHVDLTALLKRFGFQVMNVDLHQPMSSQRLLAILNTRIEASLLSNSHDFEVSQPESLLLHADQVVALQRRFGSNVRQIEGYLYERFQSFVLEGQPWPPAN